MQLAPGGPTNTTGPSISVSLLGYRAPPRPRLRINLPPPHRGVIARETRTRLACPAGSPGIGVGNHPAGLRCSGITNAITKGTFRLASNVARRATHRFADPRGGVAYPTDGPSNADASWVNTSFVNGGLSGAPSFQP